jgi:hypothetical protein
MHKHFVGIAELARQRRKNRKELAKLFNRVIPTWRAGELYTQVEILREDVGVERLALGLYADTLWRAMLLMLGQDLEELRRCENCGECFSALNSSPWLGTFR